MQNVILEKLKILKELDTNYKVFGAESHQYNFNSVLTENELILFEETHKIKLPEDYRLFLKTMNLQSLSQKKNIKSDNSCFILKKEGC